MVIYGFIQFFCHLACIGVPSTKSLNFACGLCCRSIRVQIRVDTILVRDVPEGRQRIAAYFHTSIYDVDDTQHLNLQKVAAHLSKQLDDFNRHGSGFTLDRITKFKICIAQYRPLHGSTHVRFGCKVSVHELNLLGYPTHFTRYSILQPRLLVFNIFSTSK